MSVGKWLKKRVTPPKKVRKKAKEIGSKVKGAYKKVGKKVLPPKRVRKAAGRAQTKMRNIAKTAATSTILDLFGHNKKK
tara:strand:+ start:77 stop:313 length:237 start_codon:yes stop_codon:yes gene_type:complete